MTPVAVEDDEPRRSVRQQRGWAIYQYLRDRSGKDIVPQNMQWDLGLPESGFHMALSAARHIATERGEEITFCELDGGAYILSHFSPENLDPARYFRRTLNRQKAVTAQTINLAGHLEWGAQHVPDPFIRKWAKTNATATRAVVTMASAMAELADAIKEAQQEAASN